MKKLSLFALALALPAFADIAPPPARPVPPSIRAIQEVPVYLANVKGVTVRKGSTAGTLSVGFTVTYSNACVAGANTVAPLTLRKHVRGQNLLNVLIQSRNRGLRIACPAVYMPVDIRYETQVGQLSSGAVYQVSVETNGPATRAQEVLVP